MKALDVSGLNAAERKVYRTGMIVLVASLTVWFGGVWLLAREVSAGQRIGDAAFEALAGAMLCSLGGGAGVLWAKARSLPPLFVVILVTGGICMLLAIVAGAVASVLRPGGAP